MTMMKCLERHLEFPADFRFNSYHAADFLRGLAHCGFSPALYIVSGEEAKAAVTLTQPPTFVHLKQAPI